MTDTAAPIKYPPGDSAKVDNAYYLPGCEHRQHSPSYAACLFKITEIEAGRPQDLWSECMPAIKGGSCRALGMRHEEQLAGQALYYHPRQQLQKSVREKARESAWNAAIFTKKAPAPAPAAPARPKSLLDQIAATGTYADAINTAMKAPAAKPAASTTKEDLMRAARPGETLVETAKRLIAEKKAQLQPQG
jgi:hypothetical protein